LATGISNGKKDNMLFRELIRMGICAIIGLVGGLIMVYGMHSPYHQWPLVGPLYAIGFFYGAKIIFKVLGGTGKAGAKSAFSFLMGGHWIIAIILVIVLFAVMRYILEYGWLLGLPFACYALFSAWRVDSSMHVKKKRGGHNPHQPSDNGW
jgi:hypothetical protein